MKNHPTALLNDVIHFRYPSTEQLRKLFDYSLDIICAIDIDGRFIHVSNAAMDVLGFNPEELIEHPYLNFVIDEDRHCTEEIARQIMKGHRVSNFENRYYHKDGSVISLVWSAHWDAREKIMFCIAKDVTEKKGQEKLHEQYEKKIKRQHQEMLGILERIGDGFFVLDNEWRFIYGNPQVEQMLGIQRQEFLSRNYWECFPTMVDSIYYQKYHQAMATKEPVEFDGYFPPFNKWFSVNAHPSPSGLSVFFKDITEQRKVEEELRSSNERFQLAAKSDAIYDWDLVSNELQWGEGLFNLFQYQPHELQIKDWEKALHPDEKEMVSKGLYRTLEDKTALVWNIEYQLQLKDGSYRFISETGHIIRDEEGVPVRMVGRMQDISERKRSEMERKEYKKRLEQQNKQLTNVLERMHQGFFSLNHNLQVLYWNREAEEILGILREEVIGNDIIGYYNTQAKELYTTLFNQALKEQESVHSEHLCPQTNKWMEVSIYPSKEGLSVFFKNIDDKKRTEEELKKLSLIARETMNSVVVTTPDYKISWVNDAFTKMSGYEAHEAIGKDAGEILDGPETSKESIAYILQQRKKGEPYHTEILSYRKDGKEFWSAIYGQPILDAAGNVQEFFAIETDITERKKTEEELRKLSLVAQKTNNIVVISSAQNKVVWVNAAFVKITGYSLEEVIGKSIGDVFDGPNTDPEMIQYAKKKTRNREPFQIEVLNYKKNGEVYWADVSCQPVFDAQGRLQHFFSIATDTTERKRLQQILDEEKDKRQQMITAATIAAQEMERAQVGQELHDNVNQVLTTVKLYTELCRDGIGNATEIMDKSITLLQNSIDEIRSLSKRLSAPSLGKIKLKDSIKDLVETITATNKITIGVRASDIDNLEVSHEVHLALYRILQEHFTNVLKHADAKCVQLNMDLKNEQLHLNVSDDGKGFDTTQKRKGIGITNMLTRAQSLKGSLVIISAPGKGCQLHVQIPVMTSV